MEKEETEELSKIFVANIKKAEKKHKQVLNIRYWFFIRF